MGPATGTSSRASTRPSRRKGQRGSVLLLVLAVVLMLTVGVVAVLRATTSTRVVADKLETDTKTLHRIDGALEQRINQVRDDANPAECPPGSGLSRNFGDFDVRCIGIPADPPTVASRTMDFEVERVDSDGLIGLARVKVADEINGEPLVGYSIEICDWLLGSRAVGQSLRGCSA